MNIDIDLLKRLYLASLGMVESEPDMPSHAITESTFIDAMKAARWALVGAGVNVPELAEF